MAAVVWVGGLTEMKVQQADAAYEAVRDVKATRHKIQSRH